jgi:hypothetical protein
MQQDINQLRAMIKAIPATPEGDKQIAMLINDPNPMKRMLAGIEANERARARQAQKAMQGQQQQGRPPVIQEKIAQLADAGLGSLDVGQGMFAENSYAGGGIIAFEDGGEVRHFFNGGPSDPSYESLEDYDPNKFTKNEGLGSDITNFFRSSFSQKMKIDPETKQPITLGDYLRKVEAKKVAAARAANPNFAKPDAAKPDAAKPDAAKPDAKPPVAKPDAKAPIAKSDAKAPEQPDPFSAMEAYLKGKPEEEAAARREALNQLGLEAGLEIISGESPYALQNIGRASKAARGYGERLGEFRKTQQAREKGLAELGLEKYKLAQADKLARDRLEKDLQVANIYAGARSGEGGWRENSAIQKAIQGRVKQLGGDQISKQIAMFSMGTPNEKTKETVARLQQRLDTITQQAEQEIYRQYNKPGGGAPGSNWAGWSGSPVTADKS